MNKFHSDKLENYFENTMNAFKLASDWGFWGIEFDLRMTADDKIIIHHDPHLKKNPDNLFENLTYEKAQAICKPSFSIPLFSDLLNMDLQLILFPELKSVQNSEKYLDLIAIILREKFDRETGSQSFDGKMIKFLSFNHDYLIRLKKKLANFRITNIEFLWIARFFRYQDIRRAGDSGLDGVTGHHLLADKKRIKYLKNLGLKSGFGIINSRKNMNRIQNYQTDYYFTDNYKLISKRDENQ